MLYRGKSLTFGTGDDCTCTVDQNLIAVLVPAAAALPRTLHVHFLGGEGTVQLLPTETVLSVFSAFYRAGHATIFLLRDKDNATTYVIEPQGQEKNREILRSRCLDVDGEATTQRIYIILMQKPTTLRHDSMATLSRQCCRVPNSFLLNLADASVAYCIYTVTVRQSCGFGPFLRGFGSDF